jgi:hypothetical protein
MSKPEALTPLRHFRQKFYEDLGHRQDSAFELVDAVLTTDRPSTLVRLSLSPAFHRRWPSTCDALADGSLDAAAIRQLFVHSLPTPTVERELWVLDGTAWPRPAAATSAERTWEYRAMAGKPQKHLVAAWEYQWLVAVPETGSSWVLPLDVRRRGPSAGTPTQLAISQLRAALAARPRGAPRPVVTLDTNYTPSELAEAELEADLLVRLPARRRLYRAAGPYSGRGAPRKHGPAICLHQPATHGTPDRRLTTSVPPYGQVNVDVWLDVHDRAVPHATFTLIRITIAHLPRHTRPPQPLWLAWIGGPLPTNLLDLWRWYQHRFIVEHGFRFAKHDLGWTTIRPRQPAAADRWSWLLSAAIWQLWLARPLLADTRLPWEQPLPAQRLTPGRVRRAFGRLLPGLGSPARAPRTRGKSPGRQPGARTGTRPRFAIVKRTDPHVRGCRCVHHRRRPPAA